MNDKLDLKRLEMNSQFNECMRKYTINVTLEYKAYIIFVILHIVLMLLGGCNLYLTKDVNWFNTITLMLPLYNILTLLVLIVFVILSDTKGRPSRADILLDVLMVIPAVEAEFIEKIISKIYQQKTKDNEDYIINFLSDYNNQYDVIKKINNFYSQQQCFNANSYITYSLLNCLEEQDYIKFCEVFYKHLNKKNYDDMSEEVVMDELNHPYYDFLCKHQEVINLDKLLKVKKEVPVIKNKI